MKNAKKYRKVPVEIEAIQFTGDNIESINEWVAEFYKNHPQLRCRVLTFEGDYIYIKTLEGTMECAKGNWIIRGVEGEFYPCRDSVFRATYEEA